MSAPHPVLAGGSPATSSRTTSRTAVITGGVIVAHVVALTLLLTLRHDPTPKPLESKTITAELLSPAPVAAPVALQSDAPPPPKPTPPVHREKPKVQPKPKPVPTPKPLPEAAAPSPVAVAQPDPTPPAPTPPAPPAAAAAPAIGRETMQISAPKNVSHLDCNIAKPDYPAMSRRRGESGTAYVAFVVGLSGKLEDVKIKKSSGYDRLDQAALDAVRASRCKPYLENGQPIRAAYTQPYEFGLTD